MALRCRLARIVFGFAVVVGCGKDQPVEAETEGADTSATGDGTSGADRGTTTQTTATDEGDTGERELGCCEAHRDPGCEEPAVQQCVCEVDAACCTFEWDANCATVAQTSCAATCMAVGDTGGTTTADTTNGGETTDPGGTTDGGGTTTADPGEPGNCCNYHQQPGCDNATIEQCVCAADAWCCDEGWDGKCIMAAVQNCGADCFGGGSRQSCCMTHNDPGCSDTTVQQCVCAMDPYCCNQEWDWMCVQQANADCNAMCN